jgi:tRNA(Arg) A34 adenosine deaminase TadA
MCMGSILWARIDRVYYALSMEASNEVGLGDEHFYAELARPLGERSIVPMISFPDMDREALEVYREWRAKLDRVQH